MKIYVYGTGCGAGDLADAALPAERVEAFVDRAGGGRFLGRPVITLEELAGRELDLLIVASRGAEQVEQECQRLGIAPDKLLFLNLPSFEYGDGKTETHRGAAAVLQVYRNRTADLVFYDFIRQQRIPLPKE